MNYCSKLLLALFGSLMTTRLAWAVVPATTASAVPSAGDSLGRMVFGTVIVLLVIAAIAWLLRRIMPGQTMAQRGVIKQVGGLQLSPRERVVVLEVAGRWLVVGMNAGQMTALGEVDPVISEISLEEEATATSSNGIDPNASFAVRLQQAMQTTVQQTVKSFKNKP